MPIKSKQLRDKGDKDKDKEDKDGTADEPKPKKKEPVKAYPGLDEPEPGVVLKHQTGSHMCGGQANREDLKQLMRLTTSIDFEKKVPYQKDFITYLKNEANFLAALEGACNREVTIYTLVSLFSQKGPMWRHTIKELLAKEGHYTSFRMFLDEFKVKKWPNLKQLTQSEARDCVQEGAKESVESYNERFQALHELAEADPDEHIEQFIAGLHNPEIREATRLAYFQQADRTLEAVTSHVSAITSTHEVGRKLDAERAAKTRRKGESTVAATSSTHRRAPDREYKRKSETRDRNESRRVPMKANKPQEKRQTTTAAVTNHLSHQRATEVRKRMEKFKLNGCYGCLQVGHTYREGFKNCPNTCPFCGMEFRPGGNRHFAIECRKIPTTRAAIIDVVRNAKQKDQKRR